MTNAADQPFYRWLDERLQQLDRHKISHKVWDNDLLEKARQVVATQLSKPPAGKKVEVEETYLSFKYVECLQAMKNRIAPFRATHEPLSATDHAWLYDQIFELGKIIQEMESAPSKRRAGTGDYQKDNQARYRAALFAVEPAVDVINLTALCKRAVDKFEPSQKNKGSPPAWSTLIKAFKALCVDDQIKLQMKHDLNLRQG